MGSETTGSTDASMTSSTMGAGTGSATDVEPIPAEPHYGSAETCSFNVDDNARGGWAILGLLAAFGLRRRRLRTTE